MQCMRELNVARRSQHPLLEDSIRRARDPEVGVQDLLLYVSDAVRATVPTAVEHPECHDVESERVRVLHPLRSEPAGPLVTPPAIVVCEREDVLL